MTNRIIVPHAVIFDGPAYDLFGFSLRLLTTVEAVIASRICQCPNACLEVWEPLPAMGKLMLPNRVLPVARQDLQMFEMLMRLFAITGTP